MTLVELLVVITIMAILLGAAIPVIAPADDSRRLREAARAVNTFIAGAKTRARETGRPFGVAFKKLSRDTGSAEDNGVCLELYYVEQQPPYAGFDSNSRVMLSYDTNTAGVLVPGQVNVRFVTRGDMNDPVPLPPGYDIDPLPAVIRVGDRVQVGDLLLEFNDETSPRNDQGFYTDTDSTMGAKVVSGNLNTFQVSGGPAPNSGYSQLLNLVYDGNGNRVTDTATWAAPFWTEPLRYKILRQPTKASGEPLLMNEKTAIDLEASGFGSGLRLHDPYRTDSSGTPTPNNNPDDVIVMFTPEGAMNEAYLNVALQGAGAERTLVSSNLFLLVGLRENIPAPEDTFAGFTGSDRDKQDLKDTFNWLNGDARWVVVGAQTGAVATVENAFVEPTQFAANANVSQRRDLEITAAREFARQAVSQGGK
nr:hypothetical protein [Posidoniimonas corsicana]